jgi:putative acetyltransferase
MVTKNIQAIERHIRARRKLKARSPLTKFDNPGQCSHPLGKCRPMTTIRRLEFDEIGAAAAVHRTAFDERLPWLAGRHSANEDLRYFQERVFKTCAVWGAFEQRSLVGIIAFREGWIDQLYVVPHAQRQGIGTSLLRIAQAKFSELSLWTFQRNESARRFYEAHGFTVADETDGGGNEEREPDVLYRWSQNSHCALPDRSPGNFDIQRENG